MAQRGRKLHKVDTVVNADSAEWCPYEGYQQILLCGTYKLQESQTQPNNEESQSSNTLPEGATEGGSTEPQVRVGGVTVYALTCDDETPQLMEVSQLSLCGILDIKWLPEKVEDKALFGLVDAEGYFQLLQLHEAGKTTSSVSKHKLSDSSLGLSLGWSPACTGSSYRIAASDSTGCVSVYDVSNKIELISTWSAHGYEAWITAFHNTDRNILFSGGDDCRLKRWDLRDTARPNFTSRRHQMGVCSIQSHPVKDHIFASGSYDEALIVWDDRQLKQPLADTALGGGVWRIKWDPFYGDFILTATMYNGTHIVDCRQLGESPLPVLAVYDDHNLAYGADWCPLKNDGSPGLGAHQDKDLAREKPCVHPSYLVATCSFYDHALHLWDWHGTNK